VGPTAETSNSTADTTSFGKKRMSIEQVTYREWLSLSMRRSYSRLPRSLSMTSQAHWHSRLTSSGFSETEIEKLMLMSGDY